MKLTPFYPVMSDGTQGPVLNLRPMFQQFLAETGP
jgi:hypothetical protein